MGTYARAVIVGGTVAVAFAGGLATDIGPWYQSLQQPSWKPPDAAFGPVWTLIFGLTAWACIRCWERAAEAAARRRVAWAFAANGVLNVLWSVLFFTLRRPDWAAWQVVLLWGSVAALIGLAWRIDRAAAAMLSVYLAWVTLAAMLNLAVVRLNAPV